MSIVVCNEECEGDLLAKNPVFLSSLTTPNGTDIAQKCCEGSSKNHSQLWQWQSAGKKNCSKLNVVHFSKQFNHFQGLQQQF